MLLPADSLTVAAIPGQGVEVGQEGKLLQILFHDLVEFCECYFVFIGNVASEAHLKTVHSAVISCHIGYEWCIFSGRLHVSFFDVPCEWTS